MKLVYAKNIDNVDVTGLVDVSVSPPKMFCICHETEAIIILKLFSDNKAHENRIRILKALNIKYRDKLGLSNDTMDLDLLTDL